MQNPNFIESHKPCLHSPACCCHSGFFSRPARLPPSDHPILSFSLWTTWAMPISDRSAPKDTKRLTSTGWPAKGDALPTFTSPRRSAPPRGQDCLPVATTSGSGSTGRSVRVRGTAWLPKKRRSLKSVNKKGMPLPVLASGTSATANRFCRYSTGSMNILGSPIRTTCGRCTRRMPNFQPMRSAVKAAIPICP